MTTNFSTTNPNINSVNNINNNLNNYNSNQHANANQTSNLLEEFFYIYEEDNKLLNLLKDEFSDLKFFNYGSIVYLQKENDEEQGGFPHVSELLENYEKIYSKTCYKGNLILRLTKCKR